VRYLMTLFHLRKLKPEDDDTAKLCPGIGFMNCGCSVVVL
jgi:hypothetical protein